MPYRLYPHEFPAAGIKRIAREQLEKALTQLTEAPDGRDEAVHDARKRFKKVRALLRLVRDEIGEDKYKAENVLLRDAGRRLAEVRESNVLIETIDELRHHYSDQLAEDAFAAIREQAVTHHQAVLARALDDEERMAEVAQTVRDACERVARWPIDATDFSAFRKGLRRVYKRGVKRKEDAYEDETAEAFHEWRKRIKYLWYHARILRPVWPDLMKPLAGAIHDLADDLGDAHDLADLRTWLLAGDNDGIEDAPDDERDVLLALLEQRRAELRAAARPRGERIYAEEPDDFVARIETYWSVLRSQAAD